MASINDPQEPGEPVTRLLEEIARGGRQAKEQLFPLVYSELREIARRRMSSERPDHTLDATAVVHEAYLRLVGRADVQWANRAHFFHAAAEAMRRVLVEHARARRRIKRGGGRRRDLTALEGVADLAARADPDEILAVDDAVRRLEEWNREVAAVVRLRFYAGLNPEETAKATGLSVRTVYRHWAYARAWLHRELKSSV